MFAALLLAAWPQALAGLPTEVKIRQTWAGASSPEFKPRHQIVRDPAEWKALWERVHSRQPPGPAVPEVDFGKEMVVAVFAGGRPSGGYGLEVARVERAAGGLTVRVTERTPNPDKMYTQATTAPYVLAVVPKHPGEVRVAVGRPPAPAE
ncbi:MAG: protease complex subunit PrcB family protein [Gemmataceae bacterium]|nr:protease complex subunit PrcB family protein [Gemmataceae bacterium]